MIKLDYVGAANGLLYAKGKDPLTAAQGVLVQYWCEQKNENLITAVYYASNLKIALGDVPKVKTAPDVPDEIAKAAIQAQHEAELAAEKAAAEKAAARGENESAPENEKAPAGAEASDSSEKTEKRKKR